MKKKKFLPINLFVGPKDFVLEESRPRNEVVAFLLTRTETKVDIKKAVKVKGKRTWFTKVIVSA